MTKFKQLSFWAKQHKLSSRIIIVFSFIIMNALAIITGLLLNDLDISFSMWFLIITILVFGIVWLKYPARKQHKIRAYTFRKTCDAIMICMTFFMFMYFGNRQVTPFSSTVFSASAVTSLPGDSTKGYKTADQFKKSLYDQHGKPLQWKERKKLLKQQVKAINKDKTMSDGGKVGLIILCALLALALTYGLAALTCSLTCSGSEGAAVVVGILGLAGIVLLTLFLVRAIVRKPKKEKAKEPKEEKLPASN